MTWLLLLPVVWLGIAVLLGVLVGTCIRVAASEDGQPGPCEGLSASLKEADPRFGLATAAARRSAPVAR